MFDYADSGTPKKVTLKVVLKNWECQSCTGSVLFSVLFFNVSAYLMARYENILISVLLIQVLKYFMSAGAGFRCNLNLFHNPFFPQFSYVKRKGSSRMAVSSTRYYVCLSLFSYFMQDILTLPKSQIQLKMGFFQPKYAAFFKRSLFLLCVANLIFSVGERKAI